MLTTLCMGQQIGNKKLTKAEADSIIEKDLFRRDSSFESKGIELFILNNGRVISHVDDRYNEFDSIESFKNVINAYVPTKDILFGLNPYGVDFLRHLDSLTNDLLRFLNIDKFKGVNITRGELNYIDSVIKEQNKSKIIQSKYFINCVALISKSLSELQNSYTLEMRLSEDKITFFPVLCNNGKYVPIHVYLLEAFLEEEGFEEGILVMAVDNVFRAAK